MLTPVKFFLFCYVEGELNKILQVKCRKVIYNFDVAYVLLVFNNENVKHACLSYTAKNTTDLMQVVDLTGLMQVANKLYQAC